MGGKRSELREMIAVKGTRLGNEGSKGNGVKGKPGGGYICKEQRHRFLRILPEIPFEFQMGAGCLCCARLRHFGHLLSARTFRSSPTLRCAPIRAHLGGRGAPAPSQPGGEETTGDKNIPVETHERNDEKL